MGEGGYALRSTKHRDPYIRDWTEASDACRGEVGTLLEPLTSTLGEG